MLVVETIARNRRDHLVKGVPIEKLARDLRVSRNTIRKVVRGDATSHTYERTIQPLPKLGPWVEELERRLESRGQREEAAPGSPVSAAYPRGPCGARLQGRLRRGAALRQGLAPPSPSVVAVAGLRAAELRPGRGLPVRLEPRVRAPGGCDDPGEGCAHAALLQPVARSCARQITMQLVQIFPREGQEMVFIVRSARVGARRPRRDRLRAVALRADPGAQARGPAQRRALQGLEAARRPRPAADPARGPRRRRPPVRHGARGGSGRRAVARSCARQSKEPVEAACAEALDCGTCSADVVRSARVDARRTQHPRPAAPAGAAGRHPDARGPAASLPAGGRLPALRQPEGGRSSMVARA